MVDEHNTARAVGSGSIDVFAAPMMIAVMERARIIVETEKFMKKVQKL